MLWVNNLVKRYGKQEALKDISFHVEKGQTVGLLGQNGAGKSTTMNIITGYLSSDEGEVEIQGMDILDHPIEVRQIIGYLPERPPLYERMTVQEYLSFVGELKKVNQRVVLNQSINFMRRLNLYEQRNTQIKHLSKGYKQRVGFMQALIGDPPLLILDEPMVGLDPNQIVEMRALIRDLKKEHTIILSSHILSEIETLCDHIIILDEGRVVAENTIENLEEERGKEHILRVVVKGNKGELHRILRETELVSRFSLMGEPEPDVYEFQVVAYPESDVRDQLFLLFAQNQMIVYSIQTEQFSLEEVFRKVTGTRRDENESNL